VLVDTGCNGVFVSKALVKRAELVTYQKPSAHTVRLADGSVVSSGTTARVPMRIQGVCETITAHVLDLAEHDLILGIPWQARHDVIIRPKHGTVRFRFKRARRAEEVVWVPDVHAEMNAQLKGALIISTMQLGKLWKKQTRLQLHQRTTQFYLCTIKKEGGEPETQDTDPNPQWEEKVRTLVSKFPDVVPTSTDHKPPFPPKREIEHEIDLVPGAKPVSRPMYRLSLPEEKLLSENIADLLERGYIEPSVSPFGAPVIFVKKPGDTKLRMCMDYRALNALTVKNATPMPDAEQLMDRLHGAEYYSKIDLASGYHQVRLSEESIPFSAFKTRMGLFAWRVLPFGMTGAPSTFSRLMHHILRPCLDRSVVVYLDDILIYSRTREEHLQHLAEVLELLRRHKLYARLSKCEFGKRETTFLGHVVSGKGIEMEKSKIEAVVEWPKPSTVTNVLSFLGLAGYYRRFIKGFSTIAAPLHRLTSKAVSWVWGKGEQTAFDTLKQAMVTAPILAAPDWERPFTVTTDASDFAIGAVLSQGSGLDCRPVSFLSRKLIEAETHYETHDRELLAVVYALRKWRHYLHGSRTTVVTDNWPTKFIITKPTLTPRQARWMITLAEFDLEVVHRPGCTNVVADALSRRPDYMLNAIRMTIAVDSSVIADVRTACITDPCYQRTLRDVTANRRQDFVVTDHLLYKGTRLYVPQSSVRSKLLREAHDGPLAGHFGRDKTYARLIANYYWPRMKAEVEDYCRSCPSCQTIKPSQRKQMGLHKPLQIPGHPGHSASMDLIVGLPRTQSGKTAILVIVDRLSKRVALEPCLDKSSAVELAHMFHKAWTTMGFGLPRDIVSDRDPRFLSDFWKQLHAALGTKLNFSTAYHPQTDGQTERVNRVIGDFLRAYVSPYQTDWDLFLPSAAFAINTAQHASTGRTPFEMCQGWNPADPLSSVNPRTTTGKPNVDAAAHAKLVLQGIQEARRCLRTAQERQSKSVNQKRRDVTFAVGDRVLLSAAHVRTVLPTSATAKLTHRFLGPFRVVAVIDDLAYKLALPATYRMHPVIHISHLKQFYDGESQFEWRPEYAKAPPVDVIDGEQHVHVQSFLDFRVQKSTTKIPAHLQFYVQFTDREKMWRPAADLKADMPRHYATLVKRLERHTNQSVPTDPREAAPHAVKRKGRKNNMK
jgi:hypothetical protein